MEKDSHNRLVALEGLRGVAAAVVVLMHIILTFYAVTLFGLDGNTQHLFFEDNIYRTPLTVLANGSFAVAVFFVLSGFVLSVGFFQSRDAAIVKKLAAKRYIRLMIPAAASIMISWLLIALHANSALEASKITGSAWLGTAFSLQPNFQDALWSGTVGIFLNGASNYNPVTWTMYWEFIGSFLVFIVCLVFGRSKYRWVVYAGLLLLTFKSWFLGFVIGLSLADIYVNHRQVFRGHSYGILFLLVGLFLGGFTLVVDQTTLYSSVGIVGYSLEQSRQIAYVIGAGCIMFAVLSMPRLEKILSWKYLTLLGRYTFSLYLVHMPILFTVGTGTFLWLTHHSSLGYGLRTLLSSVTFLAVTVVATWLFERYVDAPSIKLSGTFSRIVLEQETAKSSSV